MKPTRQLAARVLFPSLLIAAPSLFGSGFQLFERSASGLGNAFSGGAASAEDASIIASNPAAMIMLGGDWNTSIGVSIIDVTNNVDGFSPTLGFAGATSNNDDEGDTSFIPLIYATKRINDDIVVGLGAFSTYGLFTDYSSGFADNAATDFTELVSINFNPSVAWRVSDCFTIGAGLDVVYARGEISSRTPQAFGIGQETLFSLEGDDVAFGFNIGALIEVTDRVHLGLHYRSSIQLELDGDSSLGTGINALGLVAFPGDYDTGLDLTLPESVEASLLYKANDRLNLHADVIWTNWDRVSRLSPEVQGTLNDAAVKDFLTIDLGWDSTFRFALGATWLPTEKLTLRTGVSYDQSPVNDEDRTLRIPDRDRFTVSLGLSYQFHQNYRFDVGYSHLFADDGVIDANEDFFVGETSGYADFLSIAVSAQFD